MFCLEQDAMWARQAQPLVTKVVRCVIKYLKNQGFKFIVYLDHDMGGASDIGRAYLTSITVHNVLKFAGFLIAEYKCN